MQTPSIWAVYENMNVENYMIIYALFAELDNEYKFKLKIWEWVKNHFPFIVTLTHSRKNNEKLIEFGNSDEKSPLELFCWKIHS